VSGGLHQAASVMRRWERVVTRIACISRKTDLRRAGAFDTPPPEPGRKRTHPSPLFLQSL